MTEDRVSPRLDHREAEEVEQRLNPNAVIVHEAIRVEGQEELARPALALALSGLAAGLSMGFSLMLDGLVRSMLPEADWAPLVSSFGYSFGFLIVVLGRQQLFTESTLTAVLPLLHAPSRRQALRVARLWAIVLVTNIAGTLAFAAAMAWSDPFPARATAAFVALGREAASFDAATTVTKAVFGGWLIALMVWLLPASGDAKPLVIVAITYAVGLAELSHVVAGSAEVAYAALHGAVTWTEYAAGFLLPTLLGNSVGGVVLVSILNHGQTHQEVRGRG